MIKYYSEVNLKEQHVNNEEVSMRILIIEDDLALAECVEDILVLAGHETDHSINALDGIQMADNQGVYSLIIMDLGLPDMQGTEAINQLRNNNISTPVLVLSGRAQLENKLEALNVGADDFMMKPFHRDELLARIHAIVRRSEGMSGQIFQIGKLRVDLAHQEVYDESGRPVDLTRKEYEMFELLCRRKGHPVHKSTMLDYLYGGMDEPDVKILDVFVCTLRKKLAAANDGNNCIRTIWGRGYALNELV